MAAVSTEAVEACAFYTIQRGDREVTMKVTDHGTPLGDIESWPPEDVLLLARLVKEDFGQNLRHSPLERESYPNRQ